MSARAPRTSRRAPVPARPSVLSPAWVDGVLVVLAWMAFAALVSRGHLVTAFDSFRDMAYSHGILRGELGRDPTLPGFAAWYPAGQPLLWAAISRLTGASVLAVHGSSLFWFSWLLPLALHRLVAQSFGRTAAWWSLAFIGLGSYWWLTHAAMAMPSIQGVVPGMFTLLAWLSARSRGWLAAVGVGALGALTVSFHPICGGMVMGAILLHGVLGLALSRDATGRSPLAGRAALQACIAFATWAVLAAAILVPLLEGPILNAAPRHWFGPQLRDPLYALHAHAPLVLVFGLVGLVRAATSWERAGWLVAYAAVALPGLLAGYAAVVLGWPVPYLIPHEFQWHLQLAWCIAAALAMLDLARHWGRHLSRGAVAVSFLSVALSAVIIGPGLWHLPRASRDLIVLDGDWRQSRAVADTLVARRASGVVVAGNQQVGYLLSGMVGTRALLLPDGHQNPRADLATQLRHVNTLLQTESESTFRAQLGRTPVGYLVHLPADTSQRRRLLQRHEAWSLLERVPLADSAVLLYSVRSVVARPPVPGRSP